MEDNFKERVLCLNWYLAISWGYGWKRQPPDLEGSWEYIE